MVQGSEEILQMGVGMGERVRKEKNGGKEREDVRKLGCSNETVKKSGWNSGCTR
jgi:hypothetical protein